MVSSASLGRTAILIDISVGGLYKYLGHRRERKFLHQGRKDGLQLSHWVKVDENGEEEDKGVLFLSLHVLLGLKWL